MSEIKISSGTKVLGEGSGVVELIGDVYVSAIREEDGGWCYEVDGQRFYCPFILAEVLDRPPAPEAWRHRDGLVWMV